VEEVTALFHLLARYVVNADKLHPTEPASIMEELLPVAVPVYGGDPLPVESTRRLLSMQPGFEICIDMEIQEALVNALSAEGLAVLLEGAVEARRRESVAERRGMRGRMEQREGGQSVEWLVGIDDLSPGSFCLLSVAVLYPGT
jgi:hypothetical protein